MLHLQQQDGDKYIFGIQDHPKIQRWSIVIKHIAENIVIIMLIPHYVLKEQSRRIK
jgi:hypothetical protein